MWSLSSEDGKEFQHKKLIAGLIYIVLLLSKFMGKNDQPSQIDDAMVIIFSSLP